MGYAHINFNPKKCRIFIQCGKVGHTAITPPKCRRKSTKSRNRPDQGHS
jgi:hypothetical protein